MLQHDLAQQLALGHQFTSGAQVGGSLAFAVQAVGNASYAFKAPTTFGVRFGNCMAGDVMDDSDDFVTIPFSDSRTAVTATINPDRTFTFR